MFCQPQKLVLIFTYFLYNNSNPTPKQEDSVMMKTVDYKEMGTRIRTQRELLGYTREQLAEKLDVSTKFCADIELGVKGVSIQTLAKLSELLYLSTDYILFGESEQGTSVELNMLVMLCQKCPEKSRKELLTIVNAFITATAAN